jgi:hypothetical protein
MKTNFIISIRKHLLNAALGTIFGISALFSQSQNWWRTNGNTPQSTDFLGTSNNSPLIIKTNNLERLRIAPNGFIGISNANPQYPLDVNGRTKLRFNVYCDSLLYSSNLVVNNSIQTSTIDAHVYLVNGSPAVFSQWITLSPNSIAFNGDVYVNSLNAQSGISIGNFKFKNGSLPPQRDTIRSDRMVTFIADKSIEFKADTVRFADKVGIGKQPTAALDVNGDVAISGTMKVGNIPISTDSVANIVVVDNAGNLKTIGGIGTPPPIVCPQPISSAFWHVGGNILNPLGCNVIGSGNAADISIITDGTRRINITADGRIGFNISAPPQAPNTYIDPVVYEFNGSVSIRNNGNAGLFFGRDNVPGGTVAEFYGEWGIQYVKSSYNNNQGGGLNFWKPYQSTGANGNGFLWLGDNGNVGIGTTTPSHKLEVLGKVKIGNQSVTTGAHNDYIVSVDGKLVARKLVTTQSNWADDELTELGTLDELEKEINFALKNLHLQGVPDENEIKNNGIDIGKMFEIQIRKIEQLYKYVYLLKEEIQSLKKENEKLKLLITK